MALAAVAIIGVRHLPLAASRKRYIRLVRRRKGASSFFLPHKSPRPTRRSWPDVWSGRALQVDIAELAVCGLASMYPAFDWSV